MRVFKTKAFARFAAREGIAQSVLCSAIAGAEAGRIDADLGGGVIKQRIARPGQGKSGGYRTIIVFRKGTRAFFVYGFAKNDRENITHDELKAFRMIASELLRYDDSQLHAAVQNGSLREMDCNA
jgi:hypothetical protein